MKSLTFILLSLTLLLTLNYYFQPAGGLPELAELGVPIAATATLPAQLTARHTSPTRGVMAEAIVAPVAHVELSASTAGTVAEVLVKEGDAVVAGQLLARLNDTVARLAVDQAQAQVDEASANLALLQAGATSQAIAAAQAKVDIAQTMLDRLVAILPATIQEADQLATSQSIAQAELRSAQADLELLMAGARPEQLAAAQAELAAAQAHLDERLIEVLELELRAPISGTVAAFKLVAGEQVAEGAPVAQIADLSAWQIEILNLSEYDVNLVQLGDQAAIRIDALPNLPLTGTLTLLYPMGEHHNGEIIYGGVVRPNSHEAQLRWNMAATVRFAPRDLADAPLARD